MHEFGKIACQKIFAGTSRAPTFPDLSSTRIRPLTATSICVALTSAAMSGISFGLASKNDTARKLVPTENGARSPSARFELFPAADVESEISAP